MTRLPLVVLLLELNRAQTQLFQIKAVTLIPVLYVNVQAMRLVFKMIHLLHVEQGFQERSLVTHALAVSAQLAASGILRESVSMVVRTVTEHVILALLL